MGRIFSAVVLAAALTLLLGAGTALAGGGVKNGNFKQGDFSKWKTTTTGDQVWRLYDKNRNFTPPLNGIPPQFFANVSEPLSKYSPVIDQFSNPGTSNLYRKVSLPNKAKKLGLWFYYDNFAAQFNFGGDWDSNDNQYFSIDVLKKNAQADSSAANDIIRTLYQPDQGPVQMGAGAAASPQLNRGWNPASWKVPKKYRGKKVQLRLIVSVFDAPLQAGIDDVTIQKKK